MQIRPFQPEDEEAAISLWRQCELVTLLQSVKSVPSVAKVSFGSRFLRCPSIPFPTENLSRMRDETFPYFRAKISVIVRILSPKIPPPARFFC